MAHPHRIHRSAKELAAELLPGLEAIANIRYFMRHSTEPLEMKELRLRESRIFKELVEKVTRSLDDPQAS